MNKQYKQSGQINPVSNLFCELVCVCGYRTLTLALARSLAAFVFPCEYRKWDIIYSHSCFAFVSFKSVVSWHLCVYVFTLFAIFIAAALLSNHISLWPNQKFNNMQFIMHTVYENNRIYGFIYTLFRIASSYQFRLGDSNVCVCFGFLVFFLPSYPPTIMQFFTFHLYLIIYMAKDQDKLWCIRCAAASHT